MTKPITWFGTWLPLIKVAQSICLAIIILLFMDGRTQWIVYTVIYIFAFIALLLTLFSIGVRYFEINGRGKLSFNDLDLLMNVFFGVVSFSLSLILMWDIRNMMNGPRNYKYHKHLAPYNIGMDSWIRRCSITAGALVLTSALYLFTFVRLFRAHRR
ncbi:unnamed protein product [Caenorhabditis bovis]|uniref:MARVEL domain-containing protein n=1 Tax=Caenorhabditis bovis TaxID=2654633 RepID=A0A8S1EUE2_9PELO|nr:unnamed protein product [Caenorhabditis bovis]